MGRVVITQEVGALGPGRHVVTLEPGVPLAPGLYLARLTQGGEHATTRVVAIR